MPAGRPGTQRSIPDSGTTEEVGPKDASAADATPLDATFGEDAAGDEDATAEVDAAVDAGIDPDAGLPDAGGLVPGTIEATWIHGSADCAQNTDPPLQVHAYNADTFILRQNKCIHYEAPFIYLLFGEEKVFMQDTGATADAAVFPLRATVEDLITTWLAGRSRDSIELVVTHSHAHGDHIAADGQFMGQPGTTVVGTSVSAVSAFFGIASWPTQEVTYDLGGRVLDILPIPGHQTSHLAVYDRATGLLLTGDTLYPGRLYVSDWSAYSDSVERLGAFALLHPIAYVLGTHIEMSDSPGIDYPIGSTYQPNEHALPLDSSHLFELRDAVRALGNNPARDVHDDFIISP